VRAQAHRGLALFLGSCLAVALGWLAWAAARPPTSQETAEAGRRAMVDLLEERRAAEVEPSAARTGPEARDLYLPEDVAATLFAVRATAQVYDPWCYHMHKPGIDVDVPWDEHPAGHWRMRTNGQSLREDQELGEGPFDLRVLVTGDSHTDGYCDNRDSFANLLEAALAQPDGRAIDVLNAGNGAWSFHNYLGLLEKLLSTEPDVFVVCFFAGNDFVEVLTPHAWFARLELPREREDEAAQRKLANQISPPGYVQSVRSLQWFAHHPELAETAVAAALELMLRAQAICQREGIELVVAGLPDPLQVDREAHAELFERLARELGLDAAALAVNAQLSAELCKRLAAHGVTVLDLAQAFAPGAGPYFWKRDLHLSVLGHAAVARALEPLLAVR
jgi:lysophospholipase L1-like esterase